MRNAGVGQAFRQGGAGLQAFVKKPDLNWASAPEVPALDLNSSAQTKKAADEEPEPESGGPKPGARSPEPESRLFHFGTVNLLDA